jgi:hypothetical protein
MPEQSFSEQGITSCPLAWPVGWKRTIYKNRSLFKTSFEKARRQVFKELKLMGVPDYNVILSTNVPLRRDGFPYSGLAQPKDSGVAVYFRYKEKPMVFACDTYTKIEDNLYAVAKTIEALRGIKRWGASDMMERSFSGFQALPAPKPKIKMDWWDVLNIPMASNPEQIRTAYLRLASEYHPDRGGDPNKMAEINAAYAEARK